MNRLNVYLAVGLITVGVILLSGVVHAKDSTTTYAVTITNLTRGQIISAPVVMSHNRNYHLFTAGQPAAFGIAELAEDADTGPLTEHLETLSSVFHYAVAGGGIAPGSSVTVEINTKRGFRFISTVAMLVTTNDAFMAAKRLYAVPWKSVVANANAYDAGSEYNSELCEFIPGPPCNNPNSRQTEGAEGYVYVHSGIHGIGDLPSSEFSWLNPVAKIVIQKISL